MSAEVDTLIAEDVPAAASSSFYAAMRVLPRSQRDAMYHVYAFCRAVDDVADNGGSLFLSGAPNPGWHEDDIEALKKLHGRDFEVVKMGAVTTP